MKWFLPEEKLHIAIILLEKEQNTAKKNEVLSMVYVCHTCKREVTPEGLKTLPGVKCPYCGGRVLYKIRPPVVKRVKGV